MAEDSDGKGRGISGLVALVVLAASAIVVRQLPYSTSRPDTADKAELTADAGQDVNARLWQDPFAAVDQHRRERARDARDGVVPPEPPSRHTRADLERELEDFQPLVVMPVFTFGGPYAEDAENRRRTRYAVLSAFAVVGDYAVNDNRRIGYLRLKSGPVRIVPYEWLSSPEGRVLLLWIDEDVRWNAPLSELAGLLRELG